MCNSVPNGFSKMHTYNKYKNISCWIFSGWSVNSMLVFPTLLYVWTFS